MLEDVCKSSEPAVSLKKELSVDEPRFEPKLVADRYGTSPRKCLPRRTLPVINKFPLVSIGEGLFTKELRKVLGGTVLGPTGLPIPGFSIDPLVGQQSTAIKIIAIVKIRYFIIANTSQRPNRATCKNPTFLYVRVLLILRLFRPGQFSSKRIPFASKWIIHNQKIAIFPLDPHNIINRQVQ